MLEGEKLGSRDRRRRGRRGPVDDASVGIRRRQTQSYKLPRTSYLRLTTVVRGFV